MRGDRGVFGVVGAEELVQGQAQARRGLRLAPGEAAAVEGGQAQFAVGRPEVGGELRRQQGELGGAGAGVRLRRALLRHVEPGGDHVLDPARRIGARGVRPGEQALFAVARTPTVLVRVGEAPGADVGEDRPHAHQFVIEEEAIPAGPPLHLGEGVAGQPFAGGVEGDDPPAPIEDDDQRAGRRDDLRREVGGGGKAL